MDENVLLPDRAAWRSPGPTAIRTTATTAAATGAPLPVSVVVPARNAARWIASSLAAVRANGPAEVVVVTAPSDDGTEELARGFADRVIDDLGAGVATARMLGAEAATQPWIAFVDTDVVLPEHALATLLDEARERGLDGLQSSLRSTGEDDYWSCALAHHHNVGRSRGWFGLSATVIRREVVLRHALDTRFRSGEDIEFRHRLRYARVPVGISARVVAQHRFAPGLAFARDQWLADGAGLGRLVRKHGWRAVVPAITPFGATLVGILRSLGPEYRWAPYYVAFAFGNLVGLLRGLADATVSPEAHDGVAPDRPAEWIAFGLLALILGGAGAIAVGLGAFRDGGISIAVAAVGIAALVLNELATADRPPRSGALRAWPWLVGFLVIAIAGLRLATVLHLVA